MADNNINDKFIDNTTKPVNMNNNIDDSVNSKKPKKSANKEKKAESRARVPLHKQNKLGLQGLGLDTKNFFYHWANDNENNIDDLELGGYAKVYKDNKVIMRSRGNYETGKQILMRIPMELKIQDEKEKTQQKRVLYQGITNDFGRFNNKIDVGHFYTPE